MQNLQLVQEAAQELYKNKAGQIVALDVQGMTVICDYADCGRAHGQSGEGAGRRCG